MTPGFIGAILGAVLFFGVLAWGLWERKQRNGKSTNTDVLILGGYCG